MLADSGKKRSEATSVLMQSLLLAQEGRVQLDQKYGEVIEVVFPS